MIERTLILLFVFLISLNASAFANVITDPPVDQEGDSINQKIDGKKEGYWITTPGRVKQKKSGECCNIHR